jgi:hypothetical protein
MGHSTLHREYRIDPSIIPEGITVIYEEGDHEAFLHLFKFFRWHFDLLGIDPRTEAVNPHDECFPRCWRGNEEVTLGELLREENPDIIPGEWITIVFSMQSHIPLFQAYKKHLDEDPAFEFEDIKELFDTLERNAFGLPAQLN